MVSNLYLLSLILFVYGAFAVDLIDDTCKHAADGDPNIHYDFCMKAVGSIPKSHWANRRGLGRVSINLTKSNSTHTITYIHELMNQKLDPYVKNCLMDCLDLYENAVYSLTDAFGYFKHKLYYDANSEVSAAMDAAVTCEDGFNEREGLVSPLTKNNNDMFQLGAIALAIISMCN